MKFLHTSDWHLGVKTNGKDRLSEQKRVLDEIISIVNYENIDCVIIAGDIFNVSSPSADAEELFFDVIQKLSAEGERFVFVLAGNHDDPTRISAGLPLACKHNIALVSNLDRLNQDSFNKNSPIQVIETGKGHIKIKKNEEIATIAYLPYPSEVRIEEKVDGETYAEKVADWAQIGAGAFSEDNLNIFVSHLFMVGSKTESGVVKVGEILAVPKNIMPKADYTALGHIHIPQTLGDNIFYSGAITKLSVGQKDLGVEIIESENGKLKEHRHVLLKNIAKYEKLAVNSIEEAESKLQAFDDSDIVELEIVQNEPLSATKLKELRKNYSCISNIALKRNENYVSNTQKVISRKFLKDEELFKDFYRANRGFEPSEELVKLFLECRGGEDETN